MSAQQTLNQAMGRSGPQAGALVSVPPKQEKAPDPGARRKGGGLSILLLMGALALGGVSAYAYFFAPQPEASPPTPAPSTVGSGAALGSGKAMDLIRYEAELKEREAKLKEQELKLAEMLAKVAAGQADQELLKKRTEVYAALPPQKAAPLIKQLDDATAVEILRTLDSEQVTAIMVYMDPAVGARLLNKLAEPPAKQNP